MKKKRIRNIKCMEHCIVCGTKAIYHHIKSFGSGGKTKESNLMPLCFWHHHEIHQKGTARFVSNYNLNYYMNSKGWEFCEFSKRWILLEHGSENKS